MIRAGRQRAAASRHRRPSRPGADQLSLRAAGILRAGRLRAPRTRGWRSNRESLIAHPESL